MRRNSQLRRSAADSSKRHKPDTIIPTAPSIDELKKQKYFDIAVLAILLGLGIYNSILYFGHQVMPTSDFPAFLGVGRTILSFQLPTDFMRGPVLGMLQVLLSWMVGGQTPDLTAGWLLNAILYPANLVLLWLIGRKLLGNSAIWLAIIAVINPWTVVMLTDPIAETSLLFFILITFYFIFRQSRWSYILASVASMLRYECAVLILAAFIIDIIHHKTARERIKACVYMVLAGLPLAFWMLETFLHWQSQGSTHYLKAFTPEFSKWFKGEAVKERVGLVNHLEMLWYVGFNPLFMADPNTSQSNIQTLQIFSKIIVAISFLLGAIWGLVKKNWEIAALLIFFVPYVVVHSRYPDLIPRYYQTIFWIAMFICWYGFREIWGLINRGDRVPRPIVIILQTLLIVVALLWINILIPFMNQIKAISPPSDSVPYAVIAALIGIVVAYAVIYKAKHLFIVITVSVVMMLIVFSNQFTLASVVRDGQRDAEFQQLAKWYVANAKPGEKLAVYMAGMVQLFVVPEQKPYVVGIPVAQNQTEFVEKCRQNKIVYVVWASREGLNVNSDHYLMARLDNIAALSQQRDFGPFKYIATLQSKYGYLHIFRLTGGTSSIIPPTF